MSAGSVGILPPGARLEEVDASALRPGDRVFVPAAGSVRMGTRFLFGAHLVGVVWTVEANDGQVVTAKSDKHGLGEFPIPPGYQSLRLNDGQVPGSGGAAPAALSKPPDPGLNDGSPAGGSMDE